jgi:RNA polymerase sigma-32 factor
LDAPVGHDSDARHVDNLYSNEESTPDENLDREKMLAVVREKSQELEKELSERDLFIFRERILAEDPITLQDVGDKFGITRERARQLEARVLKKMKELLLDTGILEDHVLKK